MKMFLLTTSFLLRIAALSSEEYSLLEAFEYAKNTIPPTEWKDRLKKGDIDAGDHHPFDHIFLRYPLQKDISLPALLKVCQEVADTLPPGADFEEACYLAIGEELYDPPQAKTIIDWVMATLPPKQEEKPVITDDLPYAAAPEIDPPVLVPEIKKGDTVVAVTLPTDLGIEKSAANITVPIPPLSGLNTERSPTLNACLNTSHLPYMDWVYYASIQRVFQEPLLSSLHCQRDVEELCSPSQFILLAQPHYTFANVYFGRMVCEANTPGVSLLGRATFSQKWVISGIFDYSRSWSHWHPISGYTNDATNRWSLAPSVRYHFETAYIQGSFFGSYNASTVKNPSLKRSISLDHWGLGGSVDGAFNLFSNNWYGLQPYLSLDYFASLQGSADSPNHTYVKSSKFFQVKGLLQLFGEFSPTCEICLLPEIDLGFAFANAFSKKGSQTCDQIAHYPNWRAIVLAAKISLFHTNGFTAKAEFDTSLCHLVQLYTLNLALGWKW